jgi:hypothetical protein
MNFQVGCRSRIFLSTETWLGGARFRNRQHHEFREGCRSVAPLPTKKFCSDPRLS